MNEKRLQWNGVMDAEEWQCNGKEDRGKARNRNKIKNKKKRE